MSLCKIHSPPREEHQMIAYIESFCNKETFPSKVIFNGDCMLLCEEPSPLKKDILLMAHLDSTHTTPLCVLQ